MIATSITNPGLTGNGSLTAQAILNTDSSFLFPWGLGVAHYLDEVQVPSSQKEEFYSGVEKIHESIFSGDIKMEMAARKALAGSVMRFQGENRWGQIVDTASKSGFEWLVDSNSKMISLSPADGRSINRLFMRFADAKYAGKKVAQILGGNRLPPDQLPLEAEWDFAEAVFYCAQSDDPPSELARLVDRILRLEEDGIRVSDFSSLSNLDKLAIYIVAKRKFETQTPVELRYYSYPPFSKFVRYLRMMSWLTDITDAEQVDNPSSSFTLMAVTDYKTKLAIEGERRFQPHDLIWHQFESVTPGDILYIFFSKTYHANVEPHPFFKRAYHALIQGKNPAVIATFLENLIRYGNDWTKIAVTVLLLEMDIADESVSIQFLKSERGVKDLKRFCAFLESLQRERERQNAFSGFVDRLLSQEADPAELIAIYHILTNHYRFSNFQPKMSIEIFSGILVLEIIGLQLTREAMTWEIFIRDMKAIFNGLIFLPEAFSERFLFLLRLLLEEPDSTLVLFRQFLLKGNPHLLYLLLLHFDPRKLEEFTDLLLLYMNEHPIQGMFVMRYSADKERYQKLMEVGRRADVLVRRGPINDLEDPFEMMAVLRLLKPARVAPDFVQFILENVTIAEEDPNCDLRHFQFLVTKEKYSVHENFNKALLGLHQKRILKIKDIVAFVKQRIATLEESFPRQIRPKIFSFFGARSREEVQREASLIGEEGALQFVNVMIDAMAESGKWNKEVFDEFFIAKAWHEEPGVGRTPILKYHIEATAQEILEAVRALYEFYVIHLTNAVSRYFPNLGTESGFIAKAEKQLRDLHEKMVEQKTPIGTALVELIPSRDKLDAFFGYMADNCLATEEFALHAFRDRDFVPYRVLINGEWKGVVLTNTKIIGDQKTLVIHGIDLRLDVTVNPSEFVGCLMEGFREVALKGGYDLILVPSHKGVQSSRRVFINPEISSRFQIPYSAPDGIPFPRKGKTTRLEDYYGLHTDFLVVAVLR